uniref:BPI-like protein n=1 Tax=Trepomonas sp. PC1 TaxID=1076344 RepID=A0A146KEE7_9EUKA|eukprot:JAP94578.1 BPI-like protein [Trepomonas sp. PC1]
MQILIRASINCNLATFTAKPFLSEDDSLCTVQMPKAGLQKFVDLNVKNIVYYLNNIRIPDFEASAGIFKLGLTDIRVKDMQIPTAKMEFHEQLGSASMAINNFRFVFVFQFQLRQITYPYISDNGQGELTFSANGGMELLPNFTDACPFHLQLNNLQSSFEMSQLLIKLVGKFQFLYDSVLAVLSSVILDLLNNQLREIIISTVVNAFNSVLQDQIQITQSDSDFYSDNRYINVSIKSGFLVVPMTCQVHKMQNGVFTTWLQTSPQTRKFVYSNYQIQYFMQKEVFSTSLQNYNEFKDPNIQEMKLVVQQFARTGLVVGASNGDFQASFLFTPKLKIRVVVFNVNDTRFQLEFVKVVKCVGECSRAEEIGRDIGEKQKFTTVAISNSNNIYEENCVSIFVSSDFYQIGCQIE